MVQPTEYHNKAPAIMALKKHLCKAIYYYYYYARRLRQPTTTTTMTLMKIIMIKTKSIFPAQFKCKWCGHQTLPFCRVRFASSLLSLFITYNTLENGLNAFWFWKRRTVKKTIMMIIFQWLFDSPCLCIVLELMDVYTNKKTLVGVRVVWNLTRNLLWLRKGKRTCSRKTENHNKTHN